MRIPFEIRTPGFFILIHEKLATLRIGGRDMSVKFPEQFTTALKGMYYYTPHKLCLWWVIIIRLLCRCAAVPAHEAYIAHTAHPVLRIHFGFKKEFGLHPALILRLRLWWVYCFQAVRASVHNVLFPSYLEESLLDFHQTLQTCYYMHDKYLKQKSKG